VRHGGQHEPAIVDEGGATGLQVTEGALGGEQFQHVEQEAHGVAQDEGGADGEEHARLPGRLGLQGRRMATDESEGRVLYLALLVQYVNM